MGGLPGGANFYLYNWLAGEGMIVGSENCENNGILKCGMKRTKTQKRDEDIAGDTSTGNFEVLRSELMDLRFIVSHLREDISCSIEEGKSALKAGIQSEVGLLVYSLMEESIGEQMSLKEELQRVQEENAVLLENEEAVMEEMAKLTIESEELKKKEAEYKVNSVDIGTNTSANTISDTSANMNMDELSYYRTVVEEAKRIISENEKEVDELGTTIKSTFEDILAKFDEKYRLINDEVCSLKLKVKELGIEKEVQSAEIEMATGQLKRVTCENEARISELLEGQSETEARLRARMDELLTVNCELMDLTESYKKTNEDKESEIDLLKKTMTAQRIELERTKETLARERKISSLKISDLREQLSELQNDGDL